MTDELPPAAGLPPFATAHDTPQREEILRLLRESLAEWEARVDWDGLSERRKQALLDLARESADALRTLIAGFEAETSAGRKG